MRIQLIKGHIKTKMNYVERAFSVSVEEYKLRKEGKIPKKSLEEFLKELDEEEENSDY